MAEEQERQIEPLEKFLIATIGLFLKMDMTNIELSGMLPTGQRVKMEVPARNPYLDAQMEAMIAQKMAASNLGSGKGLAGLAGLASPFSSMV